MFRVFNLIMALTNGCNLICPGPIVMKEKSEASSSKERWLFLTRSVFDTMIVHKRAHRLSLNGMWDKEKKGTHSEVSGNFHDFFPITGVMATRKFVRTGRHALMRMRTI